MRQLEFTFLGRLRNMVFAAHSKRWNFAKMLAIQAQLHIFNPWSGWEYYVIVNSVNDLAAMQIPRT